MKTTVIFPLLLLFFFAGCIQPVSTTYICPNGSEVQDPSLCSAPSPQSETPTEEPATPPEEPAQEQTLPVENETPAPEPPPNISCYKDGGGDKFFKSTIVVRSDSTVLQQEEDVCLNSSNLKEFYCQDDAIHYTTYECKNGCEEGKCNRELVRSECIDTDGGGADHLYKRGQIIYRDYYSDGTTEDRILVEDYCEATTLHEYSCPGSLDSTAHYLHSELACLGCSDGACPTPST